MGLPRGERPAAACCRRLPKCHRTHLSLLSLSEANLKCIFLRSVAHSSGLPHLLGSGDAAALYCVFVLLPSAVCNLKAVAQSTRIHVIPIPLPSEQVIIFGQNYEFLSLNEAIGVFTDRAVGLNHFRPPLSQKKRVSSISRSVSESICSVYRQPK